MINNRFCWQRLDFRIAGKAAVLALFTLVVMPFTRAQQTGQKTFSSASQASKALVSALKSNDESALLEILGPDAKDILSSGDPTEDKSNREEFVEKYKQMHRLVDEPDGTTTLYIGAENWPTPIPLEHNKDGVWYFDTSAGKKEILYRRIGRNELSAIQVCRGLVDAEKEYYGQPHDGESGNQYAQKFVSDSGKHDGLYWQTSGGGPESPIGPALAAAAEGHAPDNQPQPFNGYYYRILTEQEDAGHARSYIVDGKMTRGFAFIAYPAEYRVSGVMTFLVDQDGIVREKDLGPHTEEIAKKLTRYDRDASWRKAD